ncbi:MFS multidrug transporter [Aureobasidium pullulans]|uniref:Cercosporin MFS transporter CTB4 n=1 Tax=Aureobasidium pullulans TaxID=5580 RepID=A0A4S8X2F0_AURPU|nr:MFS multidrug transporter [Aureobasidium pullulans]
MTTHNAKNAEEGRQPGLSPSSSDESPGIAKQSQKDSFLVTWKGKDDPENPKNWTKRQRWAATFAVASFTFISPVSSSIVAPATQNISASFGITNFAVSQISYSVFVLGYAFGPLFLSPLSEIYGRSKLLQLANLFYLIFNTVAGFSRNTGELIAFRFLSGLGGSAPLAVGGGVLGDVWLAEERGAALSIYSLGPLIGPAVGPIAGAWIAQCTTWRWTLWAPSIVDVFIQLAALKFLKETFAPCLLRRKATKLRKETGDDRYQTIQEREKLTLPVALKRGFSRPFILIGTQPIVQCLGLYMAYLYGLYCKCNHYRQLLLVLTKAEDLVLGHFSDLWVEEYHESRGISGVNYLSLGLGPIIGAQISALFNDRIYRNLKKKNNGIGRPEFRLPLMFAGSLLVPIGLFWYGWSAQAHTHWIVPNLGILVYSCGGIFGFQCIQTYLVDAYTTYAASAMAAVALGRCILAFIFPLLVKQLYDALGYGWGTSLLAFIALGLGVPFPILLWYKGETLRARSPYAATLD